jgi:hypothetical protein
MSPTPALTVAPVPVWPPIPGGPAVAPGGDTFVTARQPVDRAVYDYVRAAAEGRSPLPLTSPYESAAAELAGLVPV